MKVKLLFAVWAFTLISFMYAMGQSSFKPFGVYKIQTKDVYYTMASFGSKPTLYCSDGRIYGLKAEGTDYLIGQSLGNIDSTVGRLKWKPNSQYSTIFLDIYSEALRGEKLPLHEKRMEFSNGGQKLVGELILPLGNGPFPAIVLAHGSGQETRQSSRGMAYLFASNGIAAFIFDKRACGESTGKEWRASFKDYALDILSAVDAVSNQPEINKKKIGLYGHSQGGWVVPLAYSIKPEKISFCILSAANAMNPVDENLFAGFEELKLNGMDESTNKEIYEFRKAKYMIGITGKGMAEYKKTLLPNAEQKSWFKWTGGNLPDDVFWKENGYYDPIPALKALDCSVLVLYAQHDISTDSDTNMTLMKNAIRSSNTTYHLFENANHAMLKVDRRGLTSKLLPEVTQFADGYIDLLINWVQKQVK